MSKHELVERLAPQSVPLLSDDIPGGGEHTPLAVVCRVFREVWAVRVDFKTEEAPG